MLAPDCPGPTADALRLIDAGAAVGARNVLVASREPDPGRVADVLRQLCERADGSGMRVVLEFLPILAVQTLDDAIGIVMEVGHPGAGVLIDALHLIRSGGSPAEVSAVDPTLLPYAQLCDVAPQPPGDAAELLEEALHGRLLPGDGVAPLGELLEALPAGCPCSLEMRSRALMERWPDPTDRARAVLASVRTLS
jgi:sugar phosphate isomerase/epimerase